nr:hypothetical protein [Suaeda aralocaspica]
MESVFQLSDGDRIMYLRNLMHSYGSSYVCLWTYSPNLNAVPGLAFRDKNPCLELQESDLQKLSWSKSQRQFYSTAIFLGCERGEIELGIPEVRNLSGSGSGSGREMESVFQLSDGDRIMYLRNLMHSYGSSYVCLWTYSPNLNAVPGLAFRDKNPCLELQESDLQKLSWSKSQRQFYSEAKIKTAIFLGCERGEIELGIPEVRNLSGSGSGSGSGCHPFILQNIAFPSPESTDAALTKAYLEILSSPAPPCSSSTPSTSQSTSAFTSYQHQSSTTKRQRRQTPTLFKRAIGFYRGIFLRRFQELAAFQGGPARPSSNQLHHMISERRRREKINDSFQALRSLLPQPTKKDKASVLRSTKEYLSSLKAQVSELNKRNRLLETKVVTTISKSKLQCLQTNASMDETPTVKLIPVSVDDESTSTDEATIVVDMQLIFRRQTLLSDLIIRLLEFLKQVKEVTIISMEAQTLDEQTSSVTQDQLPTNFIAFRLRIIQGKGGERNRRMGRGEKLRKGGRKEVPFSFQISPMLEG